MNNPFEEYIVDVVEHFPYPELTSQTKRPQRYTTIMRPVAVGLLVASMLLLIIPDIRASLLKYLQIGNVTVYLDGYGSQEQDNRLNLDDVLGETDLETAQSLVDFTIWIPPDPPDRVYVQDSDMLIFVWLEPGGIEKALYQIQGFNWGIFKETDAEMTLVHINEHSGVWLEMPHPVQFVHGGEVTEALTYFVADHVLVWYVGNVIYRLETSLSMEDAIAYASGFEPQPLKFLEE